MASNNESAGPITWCAIIGITCMLLLLFKQILWLVLPILLGFVLYYLLSPMAKRLVLAGASVETAAMALSGTFLLVLGGWLLVMYPWVMANAEEWQSTSLRYLVRGSSALENILTGLQRKFSFLQNADLEESLRQSLHAIVSQFSGKHFSTAILALAGWLPSLLLTPLITYFLLRDVSQLRKFVASAVPNAYFEKTLYLIHALDRTARLFFIGLLKLAALDALFLSGGLWILGVPSALLLGIIAAVLGLIPYLGPLLGCALAVMVTSTDFPSATSLVYWVIGLFGLVRVVDDFLLMPYIIGKSMRIHPLLTLLMFVVGEAIAGVVGLMLVIPILGIVMVTGETAEVIFRDTRLRARHVFARRLRQRLDEQDLSN